MRTRPSSIHRRTCGGETPASLGERGIDPAAPSSSTSNTSALDSVVVTRPAWMVFGARRSRRPARVTITTGRDRPRAGLARESCTRAM
ncbi:MAG: hypothetical protein R3E53_12190 [Myxococcota bacterium]